MEYIRQLLHYVRIYMVNCNVLTFLVAWQFPLLFSYAFTNNIAHILIWWTCILTYVQPDFARLVYLIYVDQISFFVVLLESSTVYKSLRPTLCITMIRDWTHTLKSHSTFSDGGPSEQKVRVPAIYSHVTVVTNAHVIYSHVTNCARRKIRNDIELSQLGEIHAFVGIKEITCCNL